RRLARDPRVILALAFGALAWAPLLLWNLENGEAGLRFQLVDRHPWALHAGGLAFLPVQALVATPPLFVLLAVAAWRHVRPQRATRPQWQFLGLFGAIVLAGIFVLGFVTDSERVRFLWPVPGYLARLPAGAAMLARLAPRWQRLVWGVAGLGLCAVLGGLLAVSAPSVRTASAGSKHYPRNFAGWSALA